MKLLPMTAAALGFFLLSSWKEEGGQPPGPPGPPQPPDQANVLVIVLDDTGRDTLSCFNSTVPTAHTPRLNELAANGVRFTNMYSNPWCSPTRATIMTGRYAFRTGMGWLVRSPQLSGPEVEYSLPPGESTLAEVLKTGLFLSGAVPYKCGAFGKWHLADPDETTAPIDQGFDTFVGHMKNTGNHFDWTKVTADASGASTEEIGSPTGPFDETTFSASVVRQAAQSWINSVPQPFFAYVCFGPPHGPWMVPPHTLVDPDPPSGFPAGFKPPDTAPDDQRFAYRLMIEAVDTEIGRLVDSMDAQTRLKTTILIVSDNGTPVDVIDTAHFQASHAKGTMYEQGTHVPMIANGYQVHTGGLECDELVNTVDIWRTVLALASVTPPNPVDGKSFKSLLINPNGNAVRSHAFTQSYFPNRTYDPDDFDTNCLVTPVLYHQRAITDGHYKYIRRNFQPAQQAYDLLIDPLEQNNLWPAAWTPSVCNPTLTTQLETDLWNLRTALADLSGF